MPFWINIFLMSITSNYLKSLWINEVREIDQILRPAFKLKNRANIIKIACLLAKVTMADESTRYTKQWILVLFRKKKKQRDRFKTMSQCFKLKPFGHLSVNWHRWLSMESSLQIWQCQLTLKCLMAQVFWSTKNDPL